MNPAEAATAFFTAVAAVAAVAAVVVAIGARGVAASANTTAKDANGIAKGARDVAKTSNDIAAQANEISIQANQHAQDAQLAIIWHGMLSAVNKFLNIDLNRDDVGTAFNELRLSAILLTDELTWPELDKWLSQEQVLAATIARDCMARYEQLSPSTAEAEIEEIGRAHV